MCHSCKKKQNTKPSVRMFFFGSGLWPTENAKSFINKNFQVFKFTLLCNWKLELFDQGFKQQPLTWGRVINKEMTVLDFSVEIPIILKWQKLIVILTNHLISLRISPKKTCWLGTSALLDSFWHVKKSRISPNSAQSTEDSWWAETPKKINSSSYFVEFQTRFIYSFSVLRNCTLSSSVSNFSIKKNGSERYNLEIQTTEYGIEFFCQGLDRKPLVIWSTNHFFTFLREKFPVRLLLVVVFKWRYKFRRRTEWRSPFFCINPLYLKSSKAFTMQIETC